MFEDTECAEKGAPKFRNWNWVTPLCATRLAASLPIRVVVRHLRRATACSLRCPSALGGEGQFITSKGASKQLLVGGKGNLLLPRARASEKPDTNQTHLN